MFDLGFPPPLQKSIADKFNHRFECKRHDSIFPSTLSSLITLPFLLSISVHSTCLVSYRPPRRVIHEYGYKVEFVDQVLCSMHGKIVLSISLWMIVLNDPELYKDPITLSTIIYDTIRLGRRTHRLHLQKTK
jgi:hypothetical protein